MNQENESPQVPEWRVLGSYVATRLPKLQGDYLRGDSRAKAELARLRNVAPERDDQLLTAWDTALADAPAELIGHGDIPTPAERALVSALHLYATHQQSKSEPMHVYGVGLGQAIRNLANPADAESRERPVMRRYHALTTATEMPELLHHLRGLVSQMRAEGVALDYAGLAVDLLFLPDERTRTRVRLTWARDLTRYKKQSSEDDTDGTGADA